MHERKLNEKLTLSTGNTEIGIAFQDHVSFHMIISYDIDRPYHFAFWECYL